MGVCTLARGTSVHVIDDVADDREGLELLSSETNKGESLLSFDSIGLT